MNQLSKLTRARALEISSLNSASGRRKHGQFRIEGWRAVESAVKAGASLIEIVVRSDLAGDPRVEALAARGMSGCAVMCLPAKAAAKLASTVNDQGILAVGRIPIPDPEYSTTASRIVALDGVQDPGNVGTVVRCAAWFGFDAVIAGPGTADFFNPKVVRSMAGAVWDVSLIAVDNLSATLGRLTAAGFNLAGADLQGIPLSEWNPHGRSILVLGSEAHGLGAEIRAAIDLTGTFVRIAQVAPRRDLGAVGVESLNAAVAGGIIMHHMRK